MRPASEPPRAQKVYLLLRDRIVSGELPEGARLPSEAALTEEFAVSRVTVRRALDLLVSEGLVEKRAGSGSFVRDAGFGRPMTLKLSNAIGGLQEMGRRTEVRLLSVDLVTPAPRIGSYLGVAPGGKVQRSVRVRSFEGEPFSHLTAFVPEHVARVFEPEELAHTGLLELLERGGITVERASQEIGAVLAGVNVAQELGVGVGTPLISLTRLGFGPAGEGLEFLQALYRPDRFTLHMELTRESGLGGRRWSALAETDSRTWTRSPN